MTTNQTYAFFCSNFLCVSRIHTYNIGLRYEQFSNNKTQELTFFIQKK